MNRFASVALACLLCAAAHTAERIRPLDIGAEAPDFTLPGVDGKEHSLSDFDDAEVLVVIFTCNHCPTAQAYEGRIKDLVTNYADRSVAVVAISPNDPLAVRLDELGYTDLNDGFEDMKLRAEAEEFNFPYLYDGDVQAVSKAYGPMSTPHCFVFDADRKLRYRGRVDNSERNERVTKHDLRDAFDAVLAGEPVEDEKTPTVGCSIKWSDKRDTVTESLARWAEEEVSLQSADVDAIAAVRANDTDKLRLVNVWATWCAPCVAEMPDFVEMNRMYRKRDFELITISVDEADARDPALKILTGAEASMTNYHATIEDQDALVNAIDPDWEGGLPYTMIVAPGGEVLHRYNGAIEPLQVKRDIVAYLGRTY